MNLRPPNLIHGLTFDISLAGAADDGDALVDMIKASLLPVMDQVLAQCDQPDQLRRIEQLEIDLGTVSQEDSASELARRLFDRLSEALQWRADGEQMDGGVAGMIGMTSIAGVSDIAAERAAPPHELLLRFLRTGRLAPWLVNEAGDAHRQLLLQVLESPQALEVLRTAVNDEQMLTRLVRQFDAVSLRSVAALLTSARPEQVRAVAPQLPDDAGETAWRGLLRASLAPSVTSAMAGSRNELRDLQSILATRTLPQRAALRAAWIRLSAEVRQRLVGRQIAGLSPQAKADLTLIARQHADQLFDGFDAAEINTILRLLLAGDDVVMAVETMLAAADAPSPDVTAPAAVALTASLGPAHLASAWTSFDAVQRHTFRSNREQLLAEIAVHTGGRATSALSVAQGASLLLVLRPLATKLFAVFGDQWQATHTEALLNLLLHGSAEPTSKAASQAEQATGSRDIRPTPASRQERQVLLTRALDGLTVAQHDTFTTIWHHLSSEITRRTGNRALSTLSAQQKGDLIQLLRPIAVDLLMGFGDKWTPAHTDAALSLLLTTNDARTEIMVLLASVATTPVSVDTLPVTAEHHAPSNSIRTPQEHRILLAQGLSTSTPVRHEAFIRIWRRLSSEIADRAGSRALSSLSEPQMADLMQFLRPLAVELLAGFTEKWTPSHTEATLNLLLTTDNARTEITTLLASMEAAPAGPDSTTAEHAHPPAPHIAALQAALRAEEAAEDREVVPKPASQQAYRRLLAQALSTLTSVRHEAFIRVWRRLSSEIADRAGSRALSSLSEPQTADLTRFLRPLAVELLAGFAEKWTPSHTEATLNLLLVSDDANAEITTLLASMESTSASAAAIPISGEDRAPSDSTLAEQAGQPAPHIAALQATLRAEEVAADRDVMPEQASQQAYRELLAQALSTLTPVLHEVFIRIWQRISNEIADRAGGRAKSRLSAQQMADLTQFLRPLAVKLLTGFTEKWTPSHTEATLNLLLATDDARTEITTLLAIAAPSSTSAATAPISGEHRAHSDSTTGEQAHQPAPHIAALRAALRLEEAAADADVVTVRASQQAHRRLLASALDSLTPAQRDTFTTIWQHLSSEISRRIHGRVPSALSAQQQTDLTQLLRPLAIELLADFVATWMPSHTDATLSLLLAADDASAEIAALLDGVETMPANLATMTEEIRPPAPHISALQAALRFEEAAASHDDVPASASRQESQTLLAQALEGITPAQYQAFATIWQRLSSEISHRAGGSALSVLSSRKKAELTQLLRPIAMELLVGFAEKWTPSHTDTVLNLLLTTDDAAIEVATLLAGVTTRLATDEYRAPLNSTTVQQASPPVPHIATLQAALRVEETAASQQQANLMSPTQAGDHIPASRSVGPGAPRGAGTVDNKVETPGQVVPHSLSADQQPQVEADRFTAHHESSHHATSHNQQVGLMLLTGIWRSFSAAQRSAFQTLWRRLLDEAGNRAGGRALEALTASQRTDLTSVLQSVAAALLEEFTRQWPDALSVEDQIALAQSAAQLALADDDVGLVVASMLQEHAAVAVTPDDVVPALAAFHDWQQGKLDLQTQSLSLAELRQWLNWWLLHDPQLVNQDCSLMLSAIEAQAAHSDDPVGFMKRVLASLRAGDALDLEALSRPPDAPFDMTLAEALQSRAAIQRFIEGQGTRADGTDAGQMHQLIRAWLRHEDGDTALFMTSIEEHAARAASPQAFLLEVLRQLIADHPVDLEQLLAEEPAAVVAVVDGARLAEDDPAPQIPSTLPAQLKQALPKRLASAMLQADFASLEIIWPDLVRSHATELAQAARHYLGRSDVRERLVAHTDTAMLKDLLGALSRPALRLAETMLRHSLQYGAMLPSPLSADAFEQHVWRFAFEQALKPELGALQWLRGLTGSLQQMDYEQRMQLEHACYEVLRTAEQATALLGVLERELFYSSAQMPGVSNDAVSALLLRDAELDAAERAGLASMLQGAVVKDGVARLGTLEITLASRQAVERLADAVPGAVMARLLAALRPEVAGRLPMLLRQLKKALPISFAAVPAMLDRRIWKAIYLATFSEGATTEAPDALLPAVVNQLAGEYQADAPTWLSKVAEIVNQAIAAEAAPELTPQRAMSLLLRPWAEPKPAAVAKKPAPAKRGAEEELPFTGEANIHNAGLVIVIPYVQRLFGILELTADGKFVSDEAAERAVHLLQYVVTGEESTPEYQLVLNKLLCGIHGGMPIVPGISITDKEKTIIEQMLNGVITHWSALGKTSIAGLRETFLQRQGHLYHQDDAWHLKIPQKSFDMLIDRLPWSFAMTRMPWMAEPLNVTWRG